MTEVPKTHQDVLVRISPPVVGGVAICHWLNVFLVFLGRGGLRAGSRSAQMGSVPGYLFLEKNHLLLRMILTKLSAIDEQAP
jgi:hypothetical protein